jgi:hypothetical protein
MIAKFIFVRSNAINTICQYVSKATYFVMQKLNFAICRKAVFHKLHCESFIMDQINILVCIHILAAYLFIVRQDPLIILESQDEFFTIEYARCRIA